MIYQNILIGYNDFCHVYKIKNILNIKKALDVMSSAFTINRTIVILCVYGESCKGFNERVNSLSIIYYPWMQHQSLSLITM